MRFEFAGSFPGVALGLLGLGPRSSWMEVTDEALEVRMGWAFRLRTHPRLVASAEVVQEPVPLRLGIGVHQWGREFAVNTARRPHVLIRFGEPQRARTVGIPVRVRAIHLSPANPDALVYALSAARPKAPGPPL